MLSSHQNLPHAESPSHACSMAFQDHYSSSAKTLLSSLEAQLANFTKDKDERIAELEKQLAGERKASNELRTLNKQIEAANTQASYENQQLKQYISELNTEISELKREDKYSKLQIDALVENFTRKDAAVCDLKVKLDDARQGKSELSIQLESTKKELADMTANMLIECRNAAEERKKARKVNELITALNLRIQALEIQIAEYNSNAISEEAKTRQAISEKEELQTQVESYKRKWDVFKKDMDTEVHGKAKRLFVPRVRRSEATNF